MIHQLRPIVLATMSLTFCTLLLRPCRGQLLLGPATRPLVTRRGGTLAATANLNKRRIADWAKVYAADAAEAAALHAAVISAMKAGHANAVVAAHNQLKMVQARMAQEKAEPPFPFYFQPASPTFGLSPEVLGFEQARNKAVAAALAQWHQAQIEFNRAVEAADRQRIARLQDQVKAAMKAGHASAVVAAMAQLKQAQAQLQQVPSIPPGVPFSFSRPGNAPNGNGNGGNASGIDLGNGGSGGGGPESSNSSPNGPSAAPRRDWPKMVQQANKPVAAGSVFSLGAALQSDPHLLVGGRVTWHLGTGLGLALSPRQRLEWRRLRLAIRRHFRAIRLAAKRRETAEYRYQLGLLQAANPNATVWQVAWPVKHAEQIERAKVSRLAKKEEHADIKALAKCFRVARLHVRLVGLKGVAVPTSGPIYGVILAAQPVAIHPQTPEFSLPSGISLRAAALGPMAALQYVPLPFPGSFFGNVPPLTIPSMAVGTERVEHIRVLYCGRYPHYTGPGGGAKSGHGYVFILKSGGKLRATSYTVGQSYYHALWDGVDFPIAKDMVVKIKRQ